MSDFELFGGVEDTGKVDAASFEKFKERIKAAQAQIKALQKGEQKVRAKEEKLIKILTRFVKNHQKKDIMLLIARLLEENLPSIFILQIVLLGNEDVLEGDEKNLLLSAVHLEAADTTAISKFDTSEILPLKLKIRIDEWVKHILSAALENPHKLLKTAYTQDDKIKLPLVQLCAFILRDYLEDNNEKAEYEGLKEFSTFFISGILQQVKQKLEKMKEIKGD